jgi:hypothetical protein
MAEKVEKSLQATQAVDRKPRSLAISESGITTGKEFAQLMSALMSDLIAGRVTPSVGNAAVNAGGKLLTVVDMQYRYGSPEGGTNKILKLT